MTALGFDNYVEPLRLYLNKLRDVSWNFLKQLDLLLLSSLMHTCSIIPNHKARKRQVKEAVAVMQQNQRIYLKVRQLFLRACTAITAYVYKGLIIIYRYVINIFYRATQCRQAFLKLIPSTRQIRSKIKTMRTLITEQIIRTSWICHLLTFLCCR